MARERSQSLSRPEPLFRCSDAAAAGRLLLDARHVPAAGARQLKMMRAASTTSRPQQMGTWAALPLAAAVLASVSGDEAGGWCANTSHTGFHCRSTECPTPASQLCECVRVETNVSVTNESYVLVVTFDCDEGPEILCDHGCNPGTGRCVDASRSQTSPYACRAPTPRDEATGPSEELLWVLGVAVLWLLVMCVLCFPHKDRSRVQPEADGSGSCSGDESGGEDEGKQELHEQLAAGHVGHLKSTVHFLSWGFCLCGCCCKMERDAARLAKFPPKEVKLESLSTRPWPAQLEGGIADWQTGRRKPQNPYALEDDRPADVGQGGTRTLALTNK